MRGQGGAGFIREHIAKNGHAYVGGYAIGSEGNIPAFDYSEKDSEGVWMAQKQWLYYSLWGRLLYDPTTPDTRPTGCEDLGWPQPTAAPTS